MRTTRDGKYTKKWKKLHTDAILKQVEAFIYKVQISEYNPMSLVHPPKDMAEEINGRLKTDRTLLLTIKTLLEGR